jgi:pyruvate formate lyase activating enzyme
LEGLVLQIMRMSTEDGPGIRTTVFLKGCPLKCDWCHNPESISPFPQVHWMGSRCIGCKTCIDVCPNQALTATEDGIVINREICEGCGTCAEECPSTAMELLGTKWTVDDLVVELVKDRAFFKTSGGGVTVSGGEPTMQSRFAGEILKGLKQLGVHTALDTCGLCKEEALDRILPHSDLILHDIKEIDPEKHKAFTGSSNERILANVVRVAERVQAAGGAKEMWVRTPIIPQTTDTEENITGIGKFIASRLAPTVKRWELCSFNNMCRDKYTRLGKDWKYKDEPLLTESFMERIAEIARKSGVAPDIVHWSGATRIEEKPAAEKDRPELRIADRHA